MQLYKILYSSYLGRIESGLKTAVEAIMKQAVLLWVREHLSLL